MGDLISYMIQQSSCSEIHKTPVEVTSSTGTTAVTSESKMGEGQAPEKVKGYTLSSASSNASDGIRNCARGPASVATVGGKEGYLD